MHEHIKKRIVKDLIEEIGNLDDRDIELVGNNFIAVSEGQPMIHHGLNKDYKPANYTVDSFSDDFTVVGEYSTDKNYFTHKGTAKSPTFEKIENDVNHAVNHAAKCVLKKIYLITNQEEPNSFRKKFNTTDLAKRHSHLISFIDARRLSIGIYEQSISNPNIADFYKQFFPLFSLNLDNYEYYGKLPHLCQGHIRDDAVLDKIIYPERPLPSLSACRYSCWGWGPFFRSTCGPNGAPWRASSALPISATSKSSNT